MSKPVRRLFNLCASYGVACVLFLLLFILTLLGTLEQVNLGLYEAQEKYFGSLFLVHNLFDVIPIPLPGAYLVMVLLFVNLVCGGIIRARKGLPYLGILIAHAGIIVLLIGALVQFKFSTSGHLTLYEQQSSAEFESYYDWELAIADATGQGPYTEYLIPEHDFAHSHEGHSRTFTNAGLPFNITVDLFMPNSRPMLLDPGASPEVKSIDNYYLEQLPVERQAEQNGAGAYITLTENGGARHEAILWGFSQIPLTVDIGGKDWVIDLRRKRFSLPFTVTLDRFVHELHPGTGIAKTYMSEVTVSRDGVDQKINISMNEPLRQEGYTLYQASWGPVDAPAGTRLFSTLAVVKNPADQFPLYACVIITLGMAVHFAVRLIRYLRAESKRTR